MALRSICRPAPFGTAGAVFWLPALGKLRHCPSNSATAAVANAPGFRPGLAWCPSSERADLRTHTHYRVYLHVTWHTWRRFPCITGRMVPWVEEGLYAAARRTSVRILEKAILSDHLHLLLSVSPTTRLSDFVRLAKTISAFVSNRRSFGALKWCRGCFADSLSHRDVRAVASYIRRQHLHHPDRVPRTPRQPRAAARGNPE